MNTQTEEHTATDKHDLGYTRRVCATCGIDWPCPDFVKARCERVDLPHGHCSCGWHEEEEHA